MRLYIILILLLTNAYLTFGQFNIPNSNFEKLDFTSATKSANWIVGGTSDLCTVDSTIVWKGKYSMHLVKKTKNGFASFYQDIPFKSNGLRKYKISGVIKTKDVREKYTGVLAKVMDKDENIICRQDMGVLKINNTNDWKNYEAYFFVDEAAVKIRVAGLLFGSGEVWFDDFTIAEMPIASKPLFPIVDNYINEYFKIVKTNSVLKDTAYITSLKKKAKLLCAGNSTLDNCHFVLKNYITNKLNDGHSFFLTPQEWEDLQNGDKTIQDGLTNFANGKILEDNIAYINVSTFVSLDSMQIKKYVDSLQALITKLDSKNPIGWIIDISNNMGGNSWAMICGLGPILGNGICGYSISANGDKMTRIYNEGWTGWDTTLMFKKVNPYHLKNPTRPIAVIYGNQTASSGEVVAIAFHGKKNTLSFGQETAGATTRIDNFKLSDKAYLNLVSGVDADRNKVLFGGKIIPNKLTNDNETSLVGAIRWVIEKVN